jgi:ribosomal subunit interface protein
MEIIITGNDFEGKVEFIEYLKQKIQKTVSKFREDKIHKIHAVCTESKIGFSIKLDVTQKFDGKGIFVIENEDAEKHSAVEGAMKKLELKLVALKDKSISDRNHNGFEAKSKSKSIPSTDVLKVEIEIIDDEDIK